MILENKELHDFLPDPNKLRVLAVFFEKTYPTLYYADGSKLPDDGSGDVERDLRKWADNIQKITKIEIGD